MRHAGRFALTIAVVIALAAAVHPGVRVTIDHDGGYGFSTVRAFDWHPDGGGAMKALERSGDHPDGPWRNSAAARGHRIREAVAELPKKFPSHQQS